MELDAVLNNQENNQERDHIAAVTEEEHLEWALQESRKVDQHQRSTRPLNKENQQHLSRVVVPADNACAFHCMRLIECKRRNEDNCLSADFSAAETQSFREMIVANISRLWDVRVDTLPDWMWSHWMIDGSATVGDLAIRDLAVAAVSSKADSVHSLQGVTIGSGKPIERCIIHWTKDAESKWPGIFYVAASRPMASGDFSLAGDLTLDALASVGASDGWKKQDKEMTRLTGLSMQARRNARSVVTKPWHQEGGCHHGSRQDYVKRIAEFVSIVEAELRSASTGNPLQPPALGSAGASVRSECEACLAQWRASFLREGEQV